MPSNGTCTALTYRGNRRCRNQPEPGTDRCAFHPRPRYQEENPNAQ